MAEKSLAETNAAFNQARTDRVSGAIEAALSGNLTPPGAPGKKAATTPKAASPSSSAPSSGKPASTPTTASSSSAHSVASAAAALDSSGAAAQMNAEPESEPDSLPEQEAEALDDSADEQPALAPEIAELQALGTKKDLRALEKKLGLPEGHLGVNNASYKAYRNRVEAVEERERAHDHNQRTLIDRFGAAALLTQHAQAGNLKAYAQLIEHTTGVPIAKFVQHFAKNLTPEQLRVAELESENERLKKPAQQQPAATVDQAGAAAKADAYIQQEAGQHPAFKLEGGQEGVRRIWLASFDKASGSFKLTPQAAAAEFVKGKKAAYEREQWILSGKKPPTRPKTQTLSRQGASETQPRKQKQLSRTELIERGAAEIRRAKNRERQLAR